MDNICIYLRKSRADEEIEKTLGMGETLAKHRKTLLEYAKNHKLNIVKIREELVSGESIIQRPEMLELLKEVAQGAYSAVLCMDIQRLGRGDMEEQGIILKTFKNSNTKILTPDKAYDLNNEFDEEYSEFEAFMSRKEYKMITRRMQRGVIRSVDDGNYMSPYPPFGYIIHSEKHSRTLSPCPQQCEIVKKIFHWYANENTGSSVIAERLNQLGIKTIRGNRWTHNAVIGVIKNPVYIGKITWKKRTKSRKLRSRKDWMVVAGKHQGIIDDGLFYRAQEILLQHHKPPAKSITGLTNPLAGIVICGVCGSKMRFRTYLKSEAQLICTEKCGNKSSKFKYVEERILTSLKESLAKYELETSMSLDNAICTEVYQKNIERLNRELSGLQKQRLKLHDLLEREVYDTDTFLERSLNLDDRIRELKASISINLEMIDTERIRSSNKGRIFDKPAEIIDVYRNIEDISSKNLLLKSILDKVVYYKARDQRDDHFELDIYPKL